MDLHATPMPPSHRAGVNYAVLLVVCLLSALALSTHSGLRKAAAEHLWQRPRAAEQATLAVITTGVADGCMAGILGIATYNKCAYAALHGYQCIADAGAVERPGGGRSRHPVWGKINVMQAHLEKADWLLWMDLDIVIANWNVSALSLASSSPPDTELLLAQPAGDPTINAGMFFARRSHWTSEFFSAVQAREDLYNIWPYEQMAMWQEATRESARGRAAIEDDARFNTLCGYSNGDCHWKPGMWVKHYAPPSCPREQVVTDAVAAIMELPDPLAPVAVTDASSSTYAVALYLLDSTALRNPRLLVVVWDMGLTSEERARLQAHPSVHSVRSLTWAHYPAHASPTLGNMLVWRTILLFETMREHRAVLWVGSGAKVHFSFTALWVVIFEQGTASAGDCLPQSHHSSGNCSGALMTGWYRDHQKYESAFLPQYRFVLRGLQLEEWVAWGRALCMC